MAQLLITIVAQLDEANLRAAAVNPEAAAGVVGDEIKKLLSEKDYLVVFKRLSITTHYGDTRVDHYQR